MNKDSELPSSGAGSSQPRSQEQGQAAQRRKDAAQALRANLQRRKQQRRQRSDDDATITPLPLSKP